MGQLRRAWKGFAAGFVLYYVGGVAVHLVDEFNGAKLHNAAVEFEQKYIYPPSDENLGVVASEIQKRPGLSLDLLMFSLIVPVAGYRYDRKVQNKKKNEPGEPKP